MEQPRLGGEQGSGEDDGKESKSALLFASWEMPGKLHKTG